MLVNYQCCNRYVDIIILLCNNYCSPDDVARYM